MTKWIKFSDEIPSEDQLCIFCFRPAYKKQPGIDRVIQFMGIFSNNHGEYHICPGTFYYDEHFPEDMFSAFTPKSFKCIDIDYWMPAPADPEEYDD